MKSVMPDWAKGHVEEEWLRSMATDGMENKNLGHWQNAWRSSTLDQLLTHSPRTGSFRTIISISKLVQANRGSTSIEFF